MISKNPIPCRHWSACAVPRGGCCSIEAYDTPSHGVCMKVCQQYDGPDRTPGFVELTLGSSRVAPRPALTLAKATTFAMAAIAGKFVDDPAVVAARKQACESCEYRRIDKAGEGFCSLCGCTVSAESKRITNLAAYEENLPAWGCKHPKRPEGKGWPLRSDD